MFDSVLQIHIADRFFLGGPLELRGFKWRSVCPVEPLLQPSCLRLPVSDPTAGDASSGVLDNGTRVTCPVGAEGFWLTGAHLYTPLPYFGAEKGSLASHFRLHGFYVLGTFLVLTLFDQSVFIECIQCIQ
ncbi:unnamed protein product [Echinostoma caproni]|uniref:Bac_surface_Ag domain-containing protein n=1 Tax=Echinostoma caproni TaxID=27848 RepID=A0A183BBD6_9TREM|nr:unnamed protein product [Echinostoma caproni]